MERMRGKLKPFVAAAALCVTAGAGGAQQSGAELDKLFAELADPQTRDWQSVERKIWSEWSRSGSAAMDLLLERGRKAIQSEDYDTAIEHLTALTDHAPDFAEGWNARATAYYQAKRYGPAMTDIGRALTLNPRHFGALTGLAMILQELGYDEDALAAWRAVEAIHPHREQLKDAIEALERETGGTAL